MICCYASIIMPVVIILSEEKWRGKVSVEVGPAPWPGLLLLCRPCHPSPPLLPLSPLSLYLSS